MASVQEYIINALKLISYNIQEQLLINSPPEIKVCPHSHAIAIYSFLYMATRPGDVGTGVCSCLHVRGNTVTLKKPPYKLYQLQGPNRECCGA